MMAGSSYSPPRESLSTLGNVVHLLQNATEVDGKPFHAHPATYIAKLPGGELYFQVPDMDIDDDGSSAGSPSGWVPFPLRGGKIDRVHQNEVAYATTPPISPFQTPYIVLPGAKSSWWSKQGVSKGDGVVIIRGTVRIDAVFADIGPDQKIGEMSVEAHRQFNEDVIVAGKKPKLDGNGKPVVDTQTGKIVSEPALVTRNSGSKGPFIVIVFPHTSVKGKFVSVEQSLRPAIEQRFAALSAGPPVPN